MIISPPNMYHTWTNSLLPGPREEAFILKTEAKLFPEEAIPWEELWIAELT